MKSTLTIYFTALLLQVSATTWQVGASQTYILPSQIVALVQDNDTILIDGGVYSNDASKWTKKNLVFKGLGTGTDRTILRYTGDIPNGKGIFVFEIPGQSDNPRIENIVFDGAQVSNADCGNGAGIRFQAKDLIVINCKFMNCQNGILEGNSSVSGSGVNIEDSEFENNGYQLPDDPTFSGYEHHIYINESTEVFVLRNCYLHHPRGQANSIKTRAMVNFIEFNLINEGDTGYGSYELNIAQGGICIVVGNTFIQGPSGANHSIVGYDAVTNPNQDFYFINNTVINKYEGNINMFNVSPTSGIDKFVVYSNIFASIPAATNSMFSTNTPSALDSVSNSVSTDYSSYGFVNPAVNDFNLTSSATSAIDLGSIYATGGIFIPLSMYVDFQSPLISRYIHGLAIDIGAYELPSQLALTESQETNFAVYPNPSNGEIFINSENKIKRLELYSIEGKLIYSFKHPVSKIEIKEKGVFFLKIIDVNQQTSTEKIQVK